MVGWYAWEYKESLPTKGKKRILVERIGTIHQLLADFIRELQPYASHLFYAHWQHDQCKNSTNKNPQNSVILGMDVSENFACFYQDEIQPTHWAKNVVTVHPIVAM